MASPFPGMDPYLEARDLWSDVHITLVPRIRAQIAAQLPPGYLARLGERIVIWPEGAGQESTALPDILATRSTGGVPAPPGWIEAEEQGCLLVRTLIPEEHREHQIRIFRHDQETPVAALELLSYSNKLAGEDRDRYCSIRGKLLTSSCHLIEIDLLRSGTRMPMEDLLPPCHYLLLVSPSWMRPTCRVYPFSVKDPIPEVELPLAGEDRIRLDVGRALREAYVEARYDLAIDYRLPPRPRFREEDGAWVAKVAGQGG